MAGEPAFHLMVRKHVSGATRVVLDGTPQTSIFSLLSIIPTSSPLLLCRSHYRVLLTVLPKVGHGESGQALFLRRGEHVTTGLNTSVVLDAVKPFPPALCLDKGPPALLSMGPQALTAEMQAGVIIWTGKGVGDVHVCSPPLLDFKTHQLSSENPQSSHCDLRAPFLAVKMQQKKLLFYLRPALLQRKALTKLFVNFFTSFGDLLSEF